jgi:hypothetical protein
MVPKLTKRNNLFFAVMIFLFINPGMVQQYPGTNLRGQIQFFNPYSNNYFPLPNAVVDLYYNPSPNQYIFIGQTITNIYGFYFFYAIPPGNGNFYIQVNKAKNYQIIVYYITYYNSQYNYNQFQDIPILFY